MSTAEQQQSSRSDQPESSALAVEVAHALEDAKCTDILILDVRGLSQVTDFIIIASGTSDRQMRTAIRDAEEVAEQQGRSIFGRSSDPASTWLLVDLVDIVVHVFEPNTRAFFDLETLWGDASKVDWSPKRHHNTNME
ncbi:MAG: ribosome silencing factor [Planctomycetota bacterium]|jgi:ribosome-associated protein